MSKYISSKFSALVDSSDLLGLVLMQSLAQGRKVAFSRQCLSLRVVDLEQPLAQIIAAF